MKIWKSEDIDSLLAEILSKNGMERERARNALVAIGPPTVPYLLTMVSHPNAGLRVEIMKLLGAIADPLAAERLTEALDDEVMEVRWLAAQALIALREDALIPLLRILEVKFNSIFVRQGARHVLVALARTHLLNNETVEVLHALKYTEPRISVGVAAQRALASLRALQESRRLSRHRERSTGG